MNQPVLTLSIINFRTLNPGEAMKKIRSKDTGLTARNAKQRLKEAHALVINTGQQTAFNKIVDRLQMVMTETNFEKGCR